MTTTDDPTATIARVREDIARDEDYSWVRVSADDIRAILAALASATERAERAEAALENWKLASRTHFMRCETCEGDGFMECLDRCDPATGEEFYCTEVCGECGGTGDGQFAALLAAERAERDAALAKLAQKEK